MSIDDGSIRCPSRAARPRDRAALMAPRRPPPASRSREDGRAAQPEVLGQPARDVHVLDRLARRALDQIINARNNNCLPINTIVKHVDRAQVGAAHVPRRRHRAAIEDRHELVVCVLRLQRRLELRRAHAGRGAHVDRLFNPARHGHQVRREGAHDGLASRQTQALLDLRQVAVAGNAVRREPVRHLAEEGPLLGRAARAGRA
mmetsp:Transcript_4038/g.12490  ORF Transcript_4038/g.12490 Transcript_4038/m.12490 type:complete len:203 (-) Transcript_4038:583-1191(-)